MSDFWKAKAIAERYEFVEELGRGGIGTVVLAQDRILNKLVAIKILNNNLTNEESIRFQQEGILSGRLKHENIVSVLDFGVTDTNTPYLVMERLEGVSLAKMLAEDGALDVPFAVQIFKQICRGMQSSHSAGVVHRDLKPANVIMVPLDDGSFSARIVDFGLARMVDQNQRLTSTGSAIGSPLYMSPEQGQGQAGDERSDIYSMGCLMFEVLTGTVPFQGDTAMHTLMMHQSQQPDRLSSRSLDRFPEMLESIIAKALKKTPNERQQSFAELLTDLKSLEEEMARLEREEILESRSRSGIQKALGSVSTIDAAPASGYFKNKFGVTHFALLAFGVTFAFGVVLLIPQIKDILEDHFEEPTAPQFKDTIDMFSTLNITVNGSVVSAKANPPTTDRDFKQLSRYPRLESLDISETSMCDGTGLKYLKDTTIENLDIGSTHITNEGLKEVAEIKGIKKLRMNDCEDIDDQGVRQLLQLKELDDLFIGGENLTEGFFKYLKSFPSLQAFGLDEFKVTTGGVKEILEIPKLRTLLFSECLLDDGVIPAIAHSEKRLSGLVFLKIELTEKMVDQLAKVEIRHISLKKVKTSEHVFERIKNNPRYFWSDLKVDDDDVADLLVR
jgi:serine/threonine protein kinase